MHSPAAVRVNGWKPVFAVLTGAALCSAFLFLWSRDHLATHLFSVHARPLLEEKPPSAPPAPNERERARAKLEAAGTGFDGASFVRAVTLKHQPVIKLFRQAGIDINAPGEGGRTALLATAINRDWPLFHDLLAAGAKPELADDAGMTPLMAAAASGEVASLEALLEKGAPLNTADANGHAALHYAVVAKAVPALNFLLERGAPVTGACCPEHTLLTHAYETGDWQIIQPVLEREPGALKWEGASQAAFLGAVQTRDSARAKLLLSKYDDNPAPEGHTQPLLAYALVNNDMAGFRFLLDCGADPNSPLHSPVEKSFAQLVPRAGLRDYLQSDTSVTTLMLAAGLGRTDFIQELLTRGAKRFVSTDKYHMIALYFAAQQDEASSVQMLLGDSPTPEQVRIEISLGGQRAVVIRDGQSILSTEISTGKPGYATPTGNFVITDKHLTHKSTLYHAEMPFFMRLNCRDFGMHQGVVPGHPASHGCIRLPGAVAQRLFKEIPIGTLVSIRQ
jgi:ankyrin repeat protein